MPAAYQYNPVDPVVIRLNRELRRILGRYGYQITHLWFTLDHRKSWRDFACGDAQTANCHIKIGDVPYYVTVQAEPQGLGPQDSLMMSEQERTRYYRNAAHYRLLFRIWEQLKEFPDGTPHPNGERREAHYYEGSSWWYRWRNKRYLMRKTDKRPRIK